MEAQDTTTPFPNSSAPPLPIPLDPAAAPSVQLGFTILYTTLYAGLFVVVYVQLWLLYIYGHKRWSYQSSFLYLCLLWAALRTTLFSFYFYNAVEANHLPVAVFWLLYCFPVCLQFFTLSLINLYFTQVLVKVRQVDKGLWAARCLYGGLSIIFLCVNLVCAALGERTSDGERGERTWNLVLVRVVVNDLLFILEAVLLAISLSLVTQHSRSASIHLISKGTPVWRTAALGAAVIFLFASRACYNLTVLFLSQKYRVESFNYDWYNVSDQADLESELGNKGYLAFGAILFIWELLPTGLLILIFRVRRPAQENSIMAINNRVLPRPYFFDDPEGSDEDIPAPWANSSNSNISWYGTETAPLLFANNPPDQNHQHHTFYSTPQN